MEDFAGIPAEAAISTEADSLAQHRVSIWEGVAIIGGAVLIVAAGLAGLGIKALGNAFDSQRVEAIAQSLIAYEIPGGSTGFFGTNIGGRKMAVVTSKATVAPPESDQRSPEIELFFARMPLEEPDPTAAEPAAIPQPENELFSGFSFSYQDPAAFQISATQTEQKLFCGALTPVQVQQGFVTVADGAAPLPAVRYEVKQVLEDESRIVVISALGDKAPEQAVKVFDLLHCKELAI